MNSAELQFLASTRPFAADRSLTANGLVSSKTSTTTPKFRRRALAGISLWSWSQASSRCHQIGLQIQIFKGGLTEFPRTWLEGSRRQSIECLVQSVSKAASEAGGFENLAANDEPVVFGLLANDPAKIRSLQKVNLTVPPAKRKLEGKNMETVSYAAGTKVVSSDVIRTDEALAHDLSAPGEKTPRGNESVMKDERSHVTRGAGCMRGQGDNSNLDGGEGRADNISPAAEARKPRKTVMVDFNGEKVIEQRRNGRVVMRYKPLGIEYLYGRTKPTRLYGPLNSKGEVPGSGLAPVPKPYRERCKHQQGWPIKEAVNKILELNHWDDIDLVLNNWVGRYNRKNFPPLMAVMTRTGALKHSERLFTWMKAQRCYRARNDIYNVIIWLYARHGRVDRVRALFKEMQEWRCKPDVDTYNALINAHGRVHQWKESLLFFDRMLRASVPPSTSTYNNLISACGNSGQWQRALHLFKRMKDDGIEMDIVTHNAIITALKIGKQYDMAIAHFEQLLLYKVEPDSITLNIIISCLCKMQRHDEAIQLFNSMRSTKWHSCEPDLVTFTTVMHVYAACGQVDNVRLVFEMLTNEGIAANLMCYNTLLGAYASLGMDVEAREVFDQIQAAGFEPDIVSYTTLMNAFNKARKPDDTIQIFDLLRRRSRKPNILTYNTLIDAYGSAGRLMEALNVLSDMDYDGISPTVITVCSLIVACKESGRLDKVPDILQAARLRKIQLNINVYNTLLSLYLDEGLFEDANQLLNAAKEEGIAPDAITFSILINSASKAGNLSQAQRHFDDMLASGIYGNVEAYSALIHAFAEQGQHRAAHALATRMKKGGVAPNVATYTSLLHSYRTAGMAKDAIAVFEEMEASGVKPDAIACCELFAIFNSCGQCQSSLCLWRKQREEVHLGAAAYRELSKACFVLKDGTAARDLLEEMHQLDMGPDLLSEIHILTSLSEDAQVQTL